MAALAGAAGHARRHAENGVDIVVARNCNRRTHRRIASMVLVPEVVDAVGDTPVRRRHRHRPAGGCRPGLGVRGVDGFRLPHRQ